MPEVARRTGKLQETIGALPAISGTTALSPVHGAFSSRGLRRRIKDVGADVSTQDAAFFDRPTYGHAVLEYVWDNYDVMREVRYRVVECADRRGGTGECGSAWRLCWRPDLRSGRIRQRDCGLHQNVVWEPLSAGTAAQG